MLMQIGNCCENSSRPKKINSKTMQILSAARGCQKKRPETMIVIFQGNGIYRIQSAFEIMWLNEHTKFVDLSKTGTHGKNLYSRYQNGIPQIRVIVSPSDYGFIEQVDR